MKVVKKLFLPALLFVTTLFAACSKDDNKPSGTSHKVVFKALASAGSNIDVAVYGYDGHPTTASSLSGTTWTSPEITVPAGTVVATAAVNAIGANASSTLKVQIYVDGQLKNEGTSSGAILSASASYSF